MKVLLLGDRGYLGSYLRNALDVDTLPTRQVQDNGKEYDYVINCIGRPNLEYCESFDEETDYANKGVIKDIQKYYPASKIINFSSYYVYDGTDLNSETSKVTTSYNYTKQKIEAEKLITNGVSFRIGKLFGHPLPEKQDKLTEFIIQNQEIVLDDVLFNPTSLEQVVDAIVYEIQNNTLFGVFNLSNSGVTTHYKYGTFINDTLGTNKRITRVPKLDRIFSNYGRFAMSCDKIKQHIRLIPWEEAMLKYLKSL